MRCGLKSHSPRRPWENITNLRYCPAFALNPRHRTNRVSAGVKRSSPRRAHKPGANMPFIFSKVNAVFRALRISRQRALAAARMAALEEANDLLQKQARQLEEQTQEARELAHELALTNEEMRAAINEVEKARAAADAANRSKAEFLAVMSHELRTPLNSIGGYVDLLEMELQGPLTDGQRSDLQRIKRSQEHLLRIITDILNYTRLEATELHYDMVDVPVRALISELDAIIGSLARAKSLEYSCELPSGAVFVRTDPDKLRQILVNLLSNSVKFTAAGGRVTVRCSEQRDSVAIDVEDTGQGIPSDKLDAVFEPFVQLDSGLTRTTDGTGLGLAISRGLARGMGAHLSVRSEVGVGSVFTLTLPLSRARRPTPPRTKRAVSGV